MTDKPTYQVTVTLAYEEWCSLLAGLFVAEALASKDLKDLTFYRDSTYKLRAQVLAANLS